MEYEDPNNRAGKNRPVWPWILLMALVLLVIAFALSRAGNKRVENRAVDTAKDAAVNAGQAAVETSRTVVRDIREVLSSVDVTSFKDRKVEFDKMTVKSVGTDDMVFWINDRGAGDPGQNQGRDLLVYLNPEVHEQAHKNGIEIKDGMKVRVSGTIRLLPSEDVIRTQWKLNADDAAYLKNRLVYLDADSMSLAQ
jgi:hypothetical protein